MRKERGNILYGILFGLLMVLLFAPLIQQQCSLFSFNKLTGYEEPTLKPVFTFKDYKCGDYQYDLEQYLSENIGFREPIIRMYNQYVYDFYKKTYNREVAIEKDGWLYHTDGIKQYYGMMGQKFKDNNATFAQRLDMELRCLKKIREILKGYDVDLLVFTLPTKTYLFPQHLKDHPFVDTTFNATKYYEAGLTARDVPYINMNSWLQAVQDTLPFDLFPQKGSHWAAGAPLAVDTLLSMMEHIGNRSLVDLELGTPYPVYNIPQEDKDLEMLLNLIRPQKNDPVVEYPVTIKVSDSTQFPSVFLVGTSFYWYLKRRVNFNEVFRTRDFLYYGTQLYTDEEHVIHDKKDLDLLWELLSHDYVVYFKNGPQLYMDGFFFASKALISLCIDDNRFREKQREVADSLKNVYNAEDLEYGAFLYEASNVLWRDPELFEELRGDATPTLRNPKVEKVLARRALYNDAHTKALMEIEAARDSLDLKTVLAAEADRVMKGQPTRCSQMNLTSYDYFEVETQLVIDSIWHRPLLLDSLVKNNPDVHIQKVLFDYACQQMRQRVERGDYDEDPFARKAIQTQLVIMNMNNPKSLANLKEKAAKQGKTVEKTIDDDALWVLQNAKTLPAIGHDQVETFWKQYLIEHSFKANPKSMERIRQKAIDRDKPLTFAIIDDVLYCYNQQGQKQ